MSEAYGDLLKRKPYYISILRFYGLLIAMFNKKPSYFFSLYPDFA